MPLKKLSSKLHSELNSEVLGVRISKDELRSTHSAIEGEGSEAGPYVRPWGPLGRGIPSGSRGWQSLVECSIILRCDRAQGHCEQNWRWVALENPLCCHALLLIKGFSKVYPPWLNRWFYLCNHSEPWGMGTSWWTTATLRHKVRKAQGVQKDPEQGNHFIVFVSLKLWDIKMWKGLEWVRNGKCSLYL